MSYTNDAAKTHSLLVVGDRAVEYMSNVTTIIRSKIMLKRQNATLSKVTKTCLKRAAPSCAIVPFFS